MWIDGYNRFQSKVISYYAKFYLSKLNSLVYWVKNQELRISCLKLVYTIKNYTIVSCDNKITETDLHVIRGC